MPIFTGKVFQFIHQKLHGFLTDVQLRLGNRCNRRNIVFRNLVVIKPDDGNIFAHFDAVLMEY